MSSPPGLAGMTYAKFSFLLGDAHPPVSVGQVDALDTLRKLQVKKINQ